MTERRNHVRMMLSGVFNVYDRNTQAYLGRAANISEAGLMLVGPERIPLQADYLLEIRYEAHDGGSQRITVGAQSVWCQPAGYQNRYGVGFSFTRLSPESRAALQRLLAT